jgi:hypothetical protein
MLPASACTPLLIGLSGAYLPLSRFRSPHLLAACSRPLSMMLLLHNQCWHGPSISPTSAPASSVVMQRMGDGASSPGFTSCCQLALFFPGIPNGNRTVPACHLPGGTRGIGQAERDRTFFRAGLAVLSPITRPPLYGWSAIASQVALTYTASLVVALAAKPAGRPDLIRSRHSRLRSSVGEK